MFKNVVYDLQCEMCGMGFTVGNMWDGFHCGRLSEVKKKSNFKRSTLSL